MTIKQIIYLLLAIMLVAVFAATGVFAQSANTAQTFTVGVNTPTFTEFIPNDWMAYFDFSQLDFDSLISSGAPTTLFNGVYFYVTASGTANGYPNYKCEFKYGNNIALSNTWIGVQAQQPDFIHKVYVTSGGQPYFMTSTAQGPSGTGWGYNMITVAGATAGTSIVWDDPNGVTGERFSFTIPTGYALLIQGECDIIERDYAIYNSWNFYQNDARRVNGSRERVVSTGNIVDGFSFDHNLTFSQAIQWIPRNANLFGTSSNYDFSDHSSLTLSSGSTFLISNPQYIGSMENVGNVQTKENSVPLTGTIYMEYSTRPTIKYIAIESQIDFNQVGVYYNVFKPDVYEEEAFTTTDGTDVIVSPDYSGTTVPPDGGNSGQPPYNPDDTVEGLLSQFLHNIQSLFSRGAEAMRGIVESCNTFFSAVLSFFGWLPPEWSSVLWSFFLILTVLGVVKAFL